MEAWSLVWETTVCVTSMHTKNGVCSHSVLWTFTCVCSAILGAITIIICMWPRPMATPSLNLTPWKWKASKIINIIMSFNFHVLQLTKGLSYTCLSTACGLELCGKMWREEVPLGMAPPLNCHLTLLWNQVPKRAWCPRFRILLHTHLILHQVCNLVLLVYL